MTAQRIVRGNKTRVVLVLCVVFVVVAAIYHHENVLSKLESFKKSYEACQQQQESLQVNLQVVVDYKNRLEKSLQAERNEHKQTKTELEAKLNSEKLQREKSSDESKKQYISLLQEHKLLKAENEDLKSLHEKLQQEHMQEVEQYKSKIQELEESLKNAQNEKEKSVDQLKSENLRLQTDYEVLQSKLKTISNKQNDWENQVNHLTKENHQLRRQIDKTKEQVPNDLEIKHEENKLVLNETHQNIDDNANVLPKPSGNELKLKSNSTTSSNNINAQPIDLPTVPNSEKKEENAQNTGEAPAGLKLPKGVVPPPNAPVNDKEMKNEKVDDKNIPDEINMALPNRYRNNIIENELQKEIIKETKPEVKSETKPKQEPAEVPDHDNAAMEVIDQPKLDNSLDNNQDRNDIAVDENDQKDPVLKLMERRKKQHIDTLGLGRANEGVMHAPPGGNYEAEGDYDKEGHKDDLQLDENVEQEGEEDDDADDYDANLAARQKEPAVRN